MKQLLFFVLILSCFGWESGMGFGGDLMTLVRHTEYPIYIPDIPSEQKVILKGQGIYCQFKGKTMTFRVAQAFLPEEVVIPTDLEHPVVFHVSLSTNITLSIQSPGPSIPSVSYQDIGGLSKQLQAIRDMVELPLKSPEVFTRYNLKPPRGILLFGPPGTGKTLIAKAVASQTGAYFQCINGPEIVSQYLGETESKIRDIFQKAKENSPSIIFIDEIDTLCPKRDQSGSDLEKRVVATLLTLMDGIESSNITNGFDKKKETMSCHFVVLAATNRPNALDPALRRPGRFDREFEIGIPNSSDRLAILNTILAKIPHSLTSSDIEYLASITHGFVGADLSAVCKEAGMKAISRCHQSTNPSKNENSLTLEMKDIKSALTLIKPSAMREIMVDIPKVYWSDIGGQNELKEKLKESIEWPLKHPEAFAKYGIRPPKGILLYGPPGCSKTLMAKALATEAGLNFIAVKGPELFSKWVGDSEKAVRQVFSKARAASPSIVFFDELDALAIKRGSSGDGGGSVSDRVLTQLLNEMDGMDPLVNVTVIAATNRPDVLDPALLRPGRFDRMIYVSPPDVEARLEILRINTRKMSCGKDVDIHQLAKQTEGCSGAEVVSLCQEAAMCAMEQDVSATEVCHRHFELSLSRLNRRITPQMLAFYSNLRSKLL